MPELQTEGASIHYEVGGRADGPWVVFSNSLGTNLGMWDRQADRLGHDFRVLRYDSLGHGRSSAPPGPYTLDRLGRDALGLMDELGIERARFCGLSKGGMVGMWLATNAPERLDRLVLCNTAAHLPPRELWDARIEAVLGKGMEAVTPAVLERWFTPEFRRGGSEELERVRRMLLSTPAQGYAGACAAIRDMDQRHTIRSIGAPTLVVAGARDPATPPALSEEIAAAIPGARLTVLDAAHLSNIEAPEGFDAAVLPFLRG